MTVHYDLRNRAAIVTGGAAGIGRAIAEALRDAGAAVTVWDISQPDFAGVAYVRVDVTRPEQIAAALAKFPHPALDILVNNAGATGPSGTLLDSDPAAWRRIVDLNLIATYEVCRQVVPKMLPSPCGRVVNIASLAGKEGTPLLSAYAAAKAGVIALTKSLGKELAHTGVRVNAIAPAAVATDILRQMDAAVVAGMVAKSPMGRLGTVQEIAAVALFLCSEACGFSTGAVFDASGGRAVY